MNPLLQGALIGLVVATLGPVFGFLGKKVFPGEATGALQQDVALLKAEFDNIKKQSGELWDTRHEVRDDLNKALLGAVRDLKDEIRELRATLLDVLKKS